MQNLTYGAAGLAGGVMPTSRDLIAPDTEEDDEPNARWGGMMLVDAKRVDPAIADWVAKRGRPDGIAIRREGLNISLYYPTEGKEYVFAPIGEAPEELPKRTLVATRDLSEHDHLARRSASDLEVIATLARPTTGSYTGSRTTSVATTEPNRPRTIAGSRMRFGFSSIRRRSRIGRRQAPSNRPLQRTGLRPAAERRALAGLRRDERSSTVC